jgi:hypothetical protein
MDSNTDGGTVDAREERLHREATLREVFEQGEWLAREELDALQCPVNDWKRQGLVFSVERDGREFFARYQFDETFRPLPAIEKVLAALGEVDRWAVAAWFHYPSAWLVEHDEAGARNATPKDRLDRGDEVVAAALRRSGTYVS